MINKGQWLEQSINQFLVLAVTSQEVFLILVSVEASFAVWNVSYDVIGCSGKLSEWLTQQQA